MKKKLLRTACATLAAIFCCVGCARTGDTFKEGAKNTAPPDYTKTETVVDMYAYRAPTNGQYTTEHGATVYGETNITKERYQEYKDCGFNILLSDDEFYGGSMKTPTVETDQEYFESSQTKEILDICQEVGLKTIVFDYRIWRLSRSEISLIKTEDVSEPLWFWCTGTVYYPESVEYDAINKTVTLQDGSQREVDFVQYQFESEEELQEYIEVVMSSYKDHPAFYGVRFFDEPSEAKLTAAGQTTKAVKAVYPECYVLTCLLPYYGPALEPLLAATDEGFQKYLDMYIEETENDHFGYDFYPFVGDVISEKKAENTYVLNTYARALQISALKAKEHSIDWELVIQTYSFPSETKRVVNERDIRLQNNMALAFDASSIAYFTYWMWPIKSIVAPKGQTGTWQAIMSDTGEKILYDEVQKVNTETQKMAQAVLHYDYVSTYLSWDKDYGVMPNYFANVETSDLTNVKHVTTGRATVINEMYDEENKITGYMIVSATDTYEESYNRVEIEFSGYDKAVVYTGEGPKEVELEDNTYLTILEGGEAVFVIPY